MTTTHVCSVIGQGIKPRGTKAQCSVCGAEAVQMKAPAGGAWVHTKTKTDPGRRPR